MSGGDMSEESGEGPAAGRRHEPDDETTLVRDDEIEAIRRQLDAEYGVEIRRPAQAPARKRRRSSVIQWALTVVAGVLVGGVAAILATALYVKVTESPLSAGRGGPFSTPAPTSGGPVQPTHATSPTLPAITASAIPSSVSTVAATPPAAATATQNTPSIESSRWATSPRDPLRAAPSSPPPASEPPSGNPTTREPALSQSGSATVQNTRGVATPDSQRMPDTTSGAGRTSTSPAAAPAAEQTRLASRPPSPPAFSSGSDARNAGPGLSMARYSDPYGRFGIEYPAGWRVRTAAAGTKGTTFYLDDPDEGIAVRVLPQGALQGNLNGAALAPILIQPVRQRYPDFRITALSSRPLAAGGEQSEFSAVWTNRWAQRMRATAVIVSVARGAETNYLYMSAQAQELVFPGLEAILQRVMYSLRPSPHPG